jgi:coproporphyrinogen III oxidase
LSEPKADLDVVRSYLMNLQDEICEALEREDGAARFDRREIARDGGGMSRPRVLSDGGAIEKTAVHFTHTVGSRLPPAATDRRPELAGGSYEAVSVSLIVHPRNPYAPTSHANYRFFCATPSDGGDPVWWFGGGFDLTPYYGFEEDVVHWHETARAACAPFGDGMYPTMKAACDEYFHLPHRDEQRGVGGLFFDDLEDVENQTSGEGRFARCFAFLRSVGDAYLAAYVPILARRKDLPYGDCERDFQLVRRGRYVEYNLLYDRGTRFGLQAGARVESVLASMPPLVRWVYDWEPEPGSDEARLYTDFLQPRDWLAR